MERREWLGVRWACLTGVRRGCEEDDGNVKEDKGGGAERNIPPSSSSVPIGSGFTG
jgi:hypothetical protein